MKHLIDCWQKQKLQKKNYFCYQPLNYKSDNVLTNNSNELVSAAQWLSLFLQPSLDSAKFKKELINSFIIKNKHFWFPNAPQKASTFRSIRISDSKIDPLLEQVRQNCKFPNPFLKDYFPKNCILWIDPFEVNVQFDNDLTLYTIWKSKLLKTELPIVNLLASNSYILDPRLSVSIEQLALYVC